MESERAMKAQERTKRKKLEEELKALRESESATNKVLTQIPAEVERIKKEFEEQLLINKELNERCTQLEYELIDLKDPNPTEEDQDNQILKDMVIELLLEIRRSK